MKILKKGLSTPTAGIFYRQMAAMVAAGVSVKEALSAVAQEGKGEAKLAQTYLGEGVAEQDLFKRVFRYLNKNGQPNKRIADILYKVADEIDKYREFRVALSQIFFIPVMTLIISGVMLTIMLIFVVPVWRKMFESMSGRLPGPTQFVLDFSDMAAANMHYFVVPIFIIAILMVVKRTYLYTLFSQLPVLKRLFIHQSMVRFTRYLAVLLHIDMPLKEAADIAAGQVRNPAYAKKIKQAVADLAEKRQLSHGLQASGLITAIVGRILDAGEESGTLAQTLGEVSVLYEKEADIALANTVYWLDILIKFIVGGIVGFIVLSMYLPIFKMAGTMG